MRIHYEESGGLAGLRRTCEVDAEQLSPADRDTLLSLLDQTGISDSHEQYSPAARDARRYGITVEKDGRTFHIRVDDVTASANLRALIRFLKQQARPAPPGD
jgi:hypothetical protein